MFGYFKVGANAPKNISGDYKQYYCFLCRALEKYYGWMSRFLLSYDVVLLLILFSEDQHFSNIPKIHCVKKSPQLRAALTEELARKIATLHMLLIAAKLEDDIKDESSLKAKAATAALFFQIAKAKKTDPEMWCILRDEYALLREIESQNGTLEQLEQQFSKMMVRIGIECFGLRDPQRMAVLELASKWLYFIDAVDDLDDNLKKATFNPFSEYESFAALKNKKYLELAMHFNQLYSKSSPLFGGNSAAVLNYVLFSRMPTETINVLLKVRE